VLNRIDLELRPGETVALIGHSGSGKSTIASLLLGLAEPCSGAITVGGRDLCLAEPAAWRSQLAWVPQRPHLFSGTVADNMRLANEHASDAQVRRAAEAAAAGFIEALPDGYGTVVGEGGLPLSAGEAQRIALARAFLRDAPVLILDEPTAHLDPQTADAVGEAIMTLAAGRTTLLIAHRLELARRADRIIVLDSGRIVPVADAVSPARRAA
jgi:ABC-type multidrug transport system fused ATPase/permease subunit